MPTLNENKTQWDGQYDWKKQGDEWSLPWGGTSMQWYGVLLPRIHRFVPTGTILEIACGFGRWTHYLRQLSDRIVAIDLSQECIDACSKRFEDCSDVELHANDGRSLDMVTDQSIDLVFSFDSLVHVDAESLGAYISQLPRVLTPDGVAFLHHSNLGDYPFHSGRLRSIPKVAGALMRIGVLERSLHWRDPKVSASVIEGLAQQHGLQCISQEKVNWRTKRALIDCISVISRPHSKWSRMNNVYANPNFMHDAASLSALAPLYASD